MHKILIIDDEKDICFLISEILKDEDYITASAQNSDDAIKVYNEINPDLMLIIAEPLAYLLLGLAERQGIQAVIVDDPDDPDEDETNMLSKNANNTKSTRR